MYRCIPHCYIRKKMAYLSCCAVVWLILTIITLTSQVHKPPVLLVVSFDGFRWDYLDMVRNAGHQMAVFDSLIANGVKAKWVKNSYVTLTFPNHYTIATGLFEDNHGVVSNKMYDPVYEETFTSTHEQLRETKWWNNGSNSWSGEPIWLTNQKGPDHYSGVYFWTGSEAAINGQHAEYYMHYNWSVPYTERIDTVISWFSREQHPINLGMLYFEDPDFTGHKLGPESPELIKRLVELDEILGYIISSAKESGLFADMNLIVTSDHGMAPILDTVYLDDYMNPALLYTAYGRPPVLHLLPQDDNQLADIYEGLQRVPHVDVYKKADIPTEYHYRYNRRIMPLIVEAHQGYLICKNRASCREQAKNKGDHGYNNSLEHMHPIFIAHGPAFKDGYLSEPIHNVDIYSLMCHILGVEPAQHDGSFNNIRHILVDEGVTISNHLDSQLSHTHLSALSAVMGVLLLVCGVLCIVKYGRPSFKWTHNSQTSLETQQLLTKYTPDTMV